MHLNPLALGGHFSVEKVKTEGSKNYPGHTTWIFTSKENDSTIKTIKISRLSSNLTYGTVFFNILQLRNMTEFYPSLAAFPIQYLSSEQNSSIEIPAYKLLPTLKEILKYNSFEKNARKVLNEHMSRLAGHQTSKL